MISLLIALKRLLTSLGKVFKQPVSQALLFTLALILLGGTIYIAKEGQLPLLDAFYTSIVILIPSSLTVDYHPETAMDKIFMIIYLLTGSGTMITTLIVITKSMILKDATISDRRQQRHQD